MAATEKKRTDSAFRIIAAPARRIYRAHLDPEAVASWRPPEGMTAKIHAFDPREGGGYRMSFRYRDKTHSAGKTSEDTDVFEGRFLELVPDEKIVESVVFESDDPAFAGAMRITTTFSAVSVGTKVTIVCEDVPLGIGEGDHQAGMASTLKNLAEFTE